MASPGLAAEAQVGRQPEISLLAVQTVDLRALIAFFTIDQYKDAALGAAAGAALTGVFAGTRGLVRRIRARLPRRRLLSPWISDESGTSIYLRDMFGSTTTYFSRRPRLVGVTHQLPDRTWINISEVMGASDVRAALDIALLLGEAGSERPILLRAPDRDFNDWDTNAVLVGGHDKTERAVEMLAGLGLRFDESRQDRFVATSTGQEFAVEGRMDFGIVAKLRHPQTGAWYLVIHGLGSLGTEAAARFLRRNARSIGLLYASSPFALVVAADVAQGADSAHVVFGSVQDTMRRCLHPIAAKRLAIRAAA